MLVAPTHASHASAFFDELHAVIYHWIEYSVERLWQAAVAGIYRPALESGRIGQRSDE
jgi:hypothetical protein